MGQFAEQVQKITAAQDEILTERKRKQQEKERKELLGYFFNKYKVKAIENIDFKTSPEIIAKILIDFEKDLKKSNFDKITIKLKSKELEEFIYKEQAKNEKRTKEPNNENWKIQLYNFMDKKHKENKKAFGVLEACKFELLSYYKPDFTYNDLMFYNRLNRQFCKKYQKEEEPNYWAAAILGAIFGIYRGYKKN